VLLAGPARTVPAPIVIGIPGLPPTFLGVRPYVALRLGFYARYLGKTTAVRIESFTNDADAIKAVQSGQIDLTWAPTPVALTAIANGAPLVGIEGMDTVDWELVSIDPGISSCSRLKGQTIGVDTAGGGRYDALVAMLGTCGLTVGDVKTVGFPGSTGMNAQIAGQLTLNVSHADEAQQVAAAGKPVTVVVSLKDADPDQHYAMLVTTKDKLATSGARYVKLLEGDIAVTRWMRDPAHLAAAAQIGTITGESPAVVKDALRRDVASGWWPSATPGLSIQRVTRTIGLYTKLGTIPPDAHLTWAEVVYTHLWQAANRAVNGARPSA
jgi:ABC-type nitrate/sulfonate/bicarbonate transport system substrate-binding protein